MQINYIYNLTSINAQVHIPYHFEIIAPELLI